MELVIVLFIAALPLLAVVLLCSLVFGSRRNRGRNEEEIVWMQQMNEGLTRMGERVEALETLLSEQAPRLQERRDAEYTQR